MRRHGSDEATCQDGVIRQLNILDHYFLFGDSEQPPGAPAPTGLVGIVKVVPWNFVRSSSAIKQQIELLIGSSFNSSKMFRQWIVSDFCRTVCVRFFLPVVTMDNENWCGADRVTRTSARYQQSEANG